MTRTAIAFAMLVSTSAAAQTHMGHTQIRVSDLTNVDIYTTAIDDSNIWGAQTKFSNIDPKWNRIGEIEDVVLDADGKMIGVIAEIGGFLDIGDTEVMLKPEEFVKFSIEENGVLESEKDIVFVTGLSKEALTERKNLEESIWD